MDGITPKRDVVTQCPVCGDSFQQDGVGRMRKYCSDACKQRAHRKAHSHPSPRRQYVTVRVEYLDMHIGFALARGEYGAADALRSLARNFGAQLDEDAIRQWRKVYDNA